ncbi:type III pantothenate kinase [Paraneptunicella aestuarii]|uniref:type III pantothenate kinase n=1 Tax=Paraneptunicella aestuarii TaxID=2831148 RepID=UPI001E657314|nr:type III pantothenate kinase [Paraneptunicella aestuarii]UAA38407.1 type III pantothenate kinase [Paraneptunicella aestuarii]
MSDLTRNILIDVGNTRTKYVYCDHYGVLSSIQTLPRENVPASIFVGCQKAVIASVAKQQVIDGISDVAKAQGVEVIQVKTSASAFGIDCPYEKPETLGIDRWLCALAVATRTNDAVAILDFGTAATCDFVHAGKYLGGWIAPGFELMRNSLVSNTDKIFADNQYPGEILIGKTTESCVNQGCLAALAGFLLQAEQELQKLVENYSFILLGGSAEMLRNVTLNANRKYNIEPDLVFQGLRLFLK